MKINETQIFINMFVHYPETYNANTISNNFIKCINDSNVFKFSNNPKCHVIINSAPHSEEELIKVEFNIGSNSDVLNNKEEVTKVLKNFVNNYFNNQFKVLSIEFICL